MDVEVLLKDESTYIYGLCNPEGEIRYVGKADKPEQRLAQHLEPKSLTKVTKKNNWIKSLQSQGLQPFIHILDEVKTEHWQEAERYWIHSLREAGFDLTNGTDGGDGGAITDPEAKERRRLKVIGRKASAETRRKQSEAIGAEARSPEGRARKSRISKELGLVPPVCYGADNPASKLNEEKVLRIRERVASGESRKEIATEYGITMANICIIVTGKGWSHVGGPLMEPKQKQRLSDEQI